MAGLHGDYTLARVLIDESLAIFLQLGDKEGTGWAGR
jgi:hypothetical protein